MDVFQVLEMNISRDLSRQIITGYTFTSDDRFEINLDKQTIKSATGDFELSKKEYIDSDLGPYLRIDRFVEFFGLAMEFEFSGLRVLLPINKEYPIYQKLLRKKAHDKLKAKEVALKQIEPLPFKREYLKGGVADWLITATPMGSRQTQFFDLNIGGMLLGGDLSLSGGGDTRRGVDWKNTRYNWHYFLNDSRYLSQVELGHIFPGGPYSRAMKGITVTNKPQVRRKFFQTIIVEGQLGEGWEVELYIDGQLVDFMYTDETGHYEFNVDIYYGASTILTKLYGPNGEFRTEEINVRVPHSLIPKGEFEYTIAGGEGTSHLGRNIYSHAGCYYGINNHLTLGFGGEVPFGAEKREKPIYGGEAIFQPIHNLTVNSYYIADHSAYTGFSYSKPSVVNLNGSYTHYFPDNTRNVLSQIHNLSLSLSSPLRFLGRRFGVRLHCSFDKFPERDFMHTSYGLNASFSRFHINYAGKYKLSTYVYSDRIDENLTSELYLSTKLIRWFQPQFRLDYDHTLGQPTRYGVYLAKRVFRTGQLSLSFERNELYKTNMFMVTLNLFTGFAQFTSRLVATQQQVAMSQMQRGSLRYDNETGAVHFDRMGGVGYGSAVLKPFLDHNFNGLYDENDESIPGLRAKVRGSSGRPIGDKEVYYYDRLHPYDEYIVEIDKYSLDNPLYKPTSENYKVFFNPNIVTAIEVPIVIAGEINGVVQRQLPHGQVGVGGIRLTIVNLLKGTRTEIMTFNDGDYYYLGLIPGKYRILVDKEQLENYGYTSQPEFIDFEIRAIDEGDVINNLDFLLTPH
jgi:hypothetical protein